MKAELQNKLIETYPKYFEYLKDYKGPIMPIQFGIECEDGWFWLLNELMDCIYRYCEANDISVPNIIDIKEKNGQLSFNIYGGNELIDGMIWLTENMSYNICEFCGTTQNVGHTSGWIYTVCDSCREKDEKIKYLPFNSPNTF